MLPFERSLTLVSRPIVTFGKNLGLCLLTYSSNKSCSVKVDCPCVLIYSWFLVVGLKPVPAPPKRLRDWKRLVLIWECDPILISSMELTKSAFRRVRWGLEFLWAVLLCGVLLTSGFYKFRNSLRSAVLMAGSWLRLRLWCWVGTCPNPYPWVGTSWPSLTYYFPLNTPGSSTLVSRLFDVILPYRTVVVIIFKDLLRAALSTEAVRLGGLFLCYLLVWLGLLSGSLKLNFFLYILIMSSSFMPGAFCMSSIMSWIYCIFLSACLLC